MFATEYELERHNAKHERNRRLRREQDLEQAARRAEGVAPVAPRRRLDFGRGPFRPRQAARPLGQARRQAQPAAEAPEQRSRDSSPTPPEGPPIVVRIPRDQLGFLPEGNLDIGPTRIGGLRIEATFRVKLPSGELRPIEICAVEPSESTKDQ